MVQEILHPYSWTFGFSPGNLRRAGILNDLSRQPGQHLILVRYGHPHYIHDEWVYNGADIDSAKVVWARELGTEQDQKLMKYFAERHVWLVEPDTSSELKPYPAAPILTSGN